MTSDNPQSANWAENLVQEAEEEAPPEPGTSYSSREDEVLAKIERARAKKPRLKETHITMSHGSGGKAMHNLVEAVFVDAFHNPALDKLEDGASLSVDGQRLGFTTDSFVVSPLFFPGGNIGDLAVNGTVNDLAMTGATPQWLSAGFILEEGFPIEDLKRIVASMAAAAEAAGVTIVTGDTKVVPMDKGDGCYINTAGVGSIDPARSLGVDQVKPGDAVIVSGPIGDHGVTIMLARGELDIEADIDSDTAPLHELTASLFEATSGVRCLRDATRGGVATVLNEIAFTSQLAVIIDEGIVPVRPEVHGACEILGIDPLYVACEGRMVAVVDGDDADAAVEALRSHPLGAEAAVVGHVADDPPGLVLLKTTFGGTRIVDQLVGDPLPRIC